MYIIINKQIYIYIFVLLFILQENKSTKHGHNKLVVSIVYLKQSSYKGSEMSVYLQMCYASKILGFYIFI